MNISYEFFQTNLGSECRYCRRRWASRLGHRRNSAVSIGFAGSHNGKRALAFIGDRYHNPDYIRVSLDKVFKDLNIPIDYTIQYDRSRPEC